jgi:hypothetical protein
MHSERRVWDVGLLTKKTTTVRTATATPIQGTNPGMWHLHDHSDLASTNNGEFPGGMMTMLIIDDWSVPLDD